MVRAWGEHKQPAGGRRVCSATLRAATAGYLLKASTPAEIMDGIQLVAQGGSTMSAVIARRVVESLHGTAKSSVPKVALSERESEVLERIAGGKRVKEVTAEMEVSATTVQT